MSQYNLNWWDMLLNSDQPAISSACLTIMFHALTGFMQNAQQSFVVALIVLYRQNNNIVMKFALTVLLIFRISGSIAHF